MCTLRVVGEAWAPVPQLAPKPVPTHGVLPAWPEGPDLRGTVAVGRASVWETGDLSHAAGACGPSLAAWPRKRRVLPSPEVGLVSCASRKGAPGRASAAGCPGSLGAMRELAFAIRWR